MRPDSLKHDEVLPVLRDVHGHLSALGEDAVVDQLRRATALGIEEGPAPRSPYYSHNGAVSLLQSAIEEHKDDQFTDTDVRWITAIAGSMLNRVGRGVHPFCPSPAEA